MKIDSALAPYRCLVCDPPWQFERKPTRARPPYKTMPLEEIKSFPISNSAAKDAHLYLWVPNAFLNDGLEVMRAWGFEYVTNIIWIKHQVGLGNYWRNAHEIALFGVRGHLPPLRNDIRTWFMADRRQHSRKPDEFYSLVEQVSPGPRIDFFSREKRPGWDQWGDECDFFSNGMANKAPQSEPGALTANTEINQEIEEDTGMENGGRLLKIEEVAKLLGVAVPTLYGWVGAKRIPYRKIGRLLRFDREDIENWTRAGECSVVPYESTQR